MTEPYTAGVQIEAKIRGSFLTIGPFQQGALGCFARDAAGRPVLLTNSHVMFPKFIAAPHLGVFQPDYSSCCSGGDKIATPVFDPRQVRDGKFKGGFKTKLGQGVIPAPNEKGYTKTNATLGCSQTDCAIATLDPGVSFRNVWKTPEGEIAINGVNDDVLSVVGPKSGVIPTAEQMVRIFTPRDGGRLIYGTLTRIVTDEIPDSFVEDGRRLTPLYHEGLVFGSPDDMEANGAAPMIDQFIILPRPRPIPGNQDYDKWYAQTNQNLSFDHGDSGCVVIDSQGRVIAQVMGGFPFIPEQFTVRKEDAALAEFTKVGNVAIASPIRGIIEQLNITIPAGGFSGAVPVSAEVRVLVPGYGESAEEIAQRRTIERVRAGLRGSRRGKLLLGKIAQHRTEVRRLFATVRAIQAAWREVNGPAFYHHCVESARKPGHVIPAAINGVSREMLFEVMAPLLSHYGSQALRRDIARYGAWAVGVLPKIATLDEVPEVVRRRPEA
jgi:hypothetical protein